jgi:hypothetical protein
VTQAVTRLVDVPRNIDPPELKAKLQVSPPTVNPTASPRRQRGESGGVHIGVLHMNDIGSKDPKSLVDEFLTLLDQRLEGTAISIGAR